MIDLVKKIHFSTIQKFSLVVLVIVFCTGCFFDDNATKFAYQLEFASKRLKSQKIGSEIIIHYESEDGREPFTISLVRGGLTVYQNGTESNTTYHSRFVDVVTAQTIKGIGNADIVVKKVGVGAGHFSEEVVLIELHKQISKKL